MAFFRLFKKTFSLDYRSLAFYRFLIGIIIATDSVYRMMDLTNFYTDVGLVPRSLFLAEMAMPWSFSLLLANGSWWFAAIMFTMNTLAGLSISIGYRTRWMLVFAYIMNVSIHNRNWLINNGGDDILRAILLFSIFLPLNKIFSVDSAMEKDKPKLEGEHFSTWGLTFMLQAFVIYFVGWALKEHPIWREDFSAIFYSSRLDIFSTPLGLWLRDFPGIQKYMTLFSILLEWGGPLLLFFSFAFGRFWWWVRLAVVISFVAFHMGIAATMWIGVFPYTCMVMWLIFLPGPFWDKLASYFRGKGYGNLTIYFDGGCRFCEKSARILKEFLLLPETRVETAQNKPEVYKLMQANNSWVVEDRFGHYHFKQFGLIAILKQSPWLKWMAKVVALPIISAPAGVVYKFVSSNRPLFSKMSQWLPFTESKKPVFTLRVLYQVLGGVFFLTILNWNLTTIKKLNYKAPKWQQIARVFHLYQEWNMFAPYPKLDNVWVEAPGILMDGSEIDLITGERDVYSIKDKSFVKAVKNEHWRKFYLNVSEKVDNSRYYGGFLCRLWNERNEGFVKDVKLRRLELIVFSQLNLPSGDRAGIVRKMSWKHWCFDEDYKKEKSAEDELKQ